jgi:hypothetical protein
VVDETTKERSQSSPAKGLETIASVYCSFSSP